MSCGSPLALHALVGALPAGPQTGLPQAIGVQLELWSMLPFVLLLGAIALLPLVAHRWWEQNRNKAVVAGLLAAPVAFYLVSHFGPEGTHLLAEKGEEYAAFVVLLGSLFVITGNIFVGGSLSGTPLVNTGILGLGAVLANFIGTTGASVLLIRPFLRANRRRRRRVHQVVFFIFVVSNCGGLLTPLGDPPLFLGFLKGVPFFWTLRFWKEWALVIAALLVAFHVWDEVTLNRDEREMPGPQLEQVQVHEPLRLLGAHNFIFLLGVIGVVLASGTGLFNGGRPWRFGVAELGLLALTLASWASTPRSTRSENRFNFGPIVEVAVLFAGIFVTMAPALAILNAWGQGERLILGAGFALHSPAQFFWATGSLSAFLDNAPTYLAFAAMAAGMEQVPVEGRFLAELIAKGPNDALLLEAISCGAVLMGALTYIGNGPNFMVKAIAEENGVRMPSFLGYLGYSCLVLLPLFAALTWLCFR